MLQSQLYGRALDLCKSISEDVLLSDTGADAIVKAVFKRDPLAIVKEVYGEFMNLILLKRGERESFSNFESRFQAQVAKLNSHFSETEFPEALMAFLLLGNANVDASQKISILAACSPSSESFEGDESSEAALQMISYESVASIVRQCEKNREVFTPHGIHGNAGFPRTRRMTPQELQNKKNITKCRHEGCGKYGHWYNDHNPDGSLKPGSKSFDYPHGAMQGRFPGNSSQGQSKKISFNMVNLSGTPSPFQNPVGPLLDDGAPYSGIGIKEFNMIQSVILPSWNGTFEALPDQIRYRPFWQYGIGEHSSKARKIIGSVMLTARTDQGTEIGIRHLVIEGSSQWIIGRNVTQTCNLLRIGQNVLQLPHDSGTISLQDHDLHCYVPYHIFCSKRCEDRLNAAQLYCATAQIEKGVEVRPWKEVKAIIDKVHRHVCGHSNYTDIRVLLERNNLWDHRAEKYLPQILDTCTSCPTTALPKPARKVSLSTMSREFNKVISIDHLFLEELCVFHIMDTKSRYSVGDIVESTSMSKAIEVIEATWLSEFWAPEVIIFDQAFNTDLFSQFLAKYGIQKQPVPSRRHNKNAIESKHRVIRDIYLRLKEASKEDPTVTQLILVKQCLRVSNNLYGNEVASAHELAKGYTLPVKNGQFPQILPVEIYEAQEKLKATRKLNLILRSKSIASEEFKPGCLVQVYIKNGNEKRGKWSGDKVVLEHDHDSNTVIVPGKNGKKIHAAAEDVRYALPGDCFSSLVQESIDAMDQELEDSIQAIQQNDPEDFVALQKDENNLDHDSRQELGDGIEEIEPQNQIPLEEDDAPFCEVTAPSVGQNIEVYWPEDDKFYPGEVTSFEPQTGDIHISYADGDEEDLKIQEETWRFPSSENFAAHRVELAPGTDLSSIERNVIEDYHRVFGSKEFLLHHSQGLPSFVTQNAYEREEESFTKFVRKVHISKVPLGSNVITSHVLYKVKELDNGSKVLKARIAPHGNKDKEKEGLKADSATCAPVGMRLLLSLAVMHGWNLSKIDFKSAFLQSGPAIRDVYVVPPRECQKRSFYWLLLTAAYGLVNASAKWQEEIDSSLIAFGFQQLVSIPQLFFKRSSSGELQVMAVKIVDDVLLAGRPDFLRQMVEQIANRYEVGTIVYSPGSFLFNGLRISQQDDLSIEVDADDKLSSLKPIPVSRLRRKQIEESANAVEISAFRSSAGSIGWIGVAASPFSAFASSSMQQKVPALKVKNIVQQTNHLRMLQELGTSIKYRRPNQKGEYEISVVVFSDASRHDANGQLGYVAGIVIGDFEKGAPFHALSWMSRKSKRPVRSIGSAETIAAAIAIEEGKILAESLRELLNVDVKLRICVDSKDLWDSLTTCHEPADKSVKADVNVVRYEFETKKVSFMTWIPGKLNPADPVTKKDSPMTSPLQLMLFTGELPVDFSGGKTRESSQSTG